MIGQWLKTRRERRDRARALYFAAATQARQPAFYQEMGVPDTMDGRFEMTALHIFLLMNALKQDKDPRGEKMAQALFDRLFKVTDQAIREMGIGDLSVPRHMKRMMTAFNGRAYGYTLALRQGKGMGDALRRNVYGTVGSVAPHALAQLEFYVADAIAALNKEDILAGQVDFPAPLTMQEIRAHG